MINNYKHQDGLKLKKHHKLIIKEWLEDGPNITIFAVKEMFEKQFNLIVIWLPFFGQFSTIKNQNYVQESKKQLSFRI